MLFVSVTIGLGGKQSGSKAADHITHLVEELFACEFPDSPLLSVQPCCSLLEAPPSPDPASSVVGDASEPALPWISVPKLSFRDLPGKLTNKAFVT